MEMYTRYPLQRNEGMNSQVITLEIELCPTNETSRYAVREVKLSQSAVYTSRRARFEEEELQNKRPLGAIICRTN